MIRTFFLERTNQVRQSLRRYSRGGGECSHFAHNGYHNAEVVIGTVEVPCEDDRGQLDTITSVVYGDKVGGVVDKNDPRWPRSCVCGYQFTEQDEKQYFPQRLYRSPAHPDLMTLHESPVGAMWYEDRQHTSGPDGRSLCVRIPKNHVWSVDARAKNCDSPCKWCGKPYHNHNKDQCSNPGNPEYSWTKGSYEDSRPEHRCWVRHGDPRVKVHVDKQGVTCNAGAGSIVSPDDWHGFLHDGHLIEC